MRKTSFRALGLAFLVAVASPALAQQRTASDFAQARELFNQGIDQRDQKNDPKGALEKFKAAHALAGTPVTGVELGRTLMMMGLLIEARETFLSIARIPVQPQETANSASARNEAAQLSEQVRARIPALSMKISGAPEGSVSVVVDGAPVSSVALSAPRLVNPGDHTVVATSRKGERVDASVTVKDGETREVELKFGVPPVPATTTAPPSATTTAPPAPTATTTATVVSAPSGAHTSPLVWVGFGVAGAGLIAGSITGLMAFGDASSVKNACNGTTCPKSVDSDLQGGRTLGWVSTIAFITAGVGAGLGVAGIFLSKKGASTTAARVEPWVGVGSAGLRGSF